MPTTHHATATARLLAPLAAALLATAGCDPAEGSDARASLDMCRYDDFSVDITSGPNAGLSLTGTLFFIRNQPDTRLGGHMMTNDGEVIPITATVNENHDLALTFRTKVGYVMGLGPMTGDLCAADNIEGVAVGPVIAATSDVADSDHGHWLLKTPTPIDEVPQIELDYPNDPDVVDGDGFTSNVTAQTCTKSGGVVVLKCSLLCLFTYEVCQGGDKNGEVIVNGTQS